MAIKRIEVMAPPTQEKTTGKRKGWGGIGSKIGTVAGSVVGGLAAASVGAGATVATGGAAAPATPSMIAAGVAGGALVGNQLGSMVGEKLRASREGSTSIDRRLAYQAEGPASGAPSAADKLKESLMAISQAPMEVKQQYAPELLNAYMKTAYQNGK